MPSTIVVADDEEAVRRIIQLTLEEAGYQVLDAADGKAALAVSAGFAGPIRLLIADVVQPGLDGRALAEQLTAERPEVKVLFISGHDYLDRVEPVIAFLAKPFKPKDLLRKVQTLIDD